RLAAEVSLRNQDYGRAADLASQAVSGDSKNYGDLIWLGQVLWASGQTAKGEQALRQAVERFGQASETWVALVQFLARTNQKDKAEAEIDKAVKQYAGAKAPLALAQCYEVVGRLDQAEKQFELALAAQPNGVGVVHQVADFYLRNGKRQQAEPHLRHLL